jgi:FkbM family methyltransferase
VHSARFIYLLLIGKPDPETALLSRFLKPGDVGVDIGANGANWTLAIGNAVKPGGRVFAFEADPYYAKVTEHTLRILLRRDVTLLPYGLSERDEVVRFRVLDEHGRRLSGRSGVAPVNHSSGLGLRDVHLRRLDDLISEYPQLRKCRFIKCDVEGYELFVFRGAVAILQCSRPAVVLEAGDFSPFGYDAGTLYEFFKNLDYVALGFNPNGRLVKTDSKLWFIDPVSVNRVLLPVEQLNLVSDLIDE